MGKAILLLLCLVLLSVVAVESVAAQNGLGPGERVDGRSGPAPDSGGSGTAASQRDSEPSETILARAEAEAPVGAALFAANCSVCHGATGLGLEEAKLAFPPDHRDCSRCHKRGNAPTMSLRQIEMRQHDLFDVGEPPPLRGVGSLAAHAPPEAVRTYISAAMPRYRPGALSQEEYAAVTAFLLALNGR
ncbi:MAG TPA: c-type cytochrome [Trueperaceae bacterium]